jgi:hypothetical protein
MASSIGRGDPEYAAAMREAKALFEAAMAKGAMKGGRPRTNAAAPAPVAAPAAVAEDDVDMSDVIAEATVEEPTPVAAPAAAAPTAAAPAKRTRRRAKGESA